MGLGTGLARGWQGVGKGWVRGSLSLDSGGEGLVHQSHEVEAALRDALPLPLGHDDAAPLLVDEQRVRVKGER